MQVVLKEEGPIIFSILNHFCIKKLGNAEICLGTKTSDYLITGDAKSVKKVVAYYKQLLIERKESGFVAFNKKYWEWA
jgi:hypothetical protein